MKNIIGVFDSGIGGLTTLNEIIKLLPNENYIYYADTKNNPYGEKDVEELYVIVKKIVNKLLKRNAKLIVIACNTATTRYIERLRKDYPNTLFVGTEPAIKVACDNNYKNTLVMATPGTISSEKMQNLIRANKKDDQKITLLACEGLANAIERKSSNEINEVLHKLLDRYRNENFDSIVLGCTHYPYIKNEINTFFPNAKLIDGNIGVAKRVKYIFETNYELNHSNNRNIEYIESK